MSLNTSLHDVLQGMVEEKGFSVDMRESTAGGI